MNWKHLRHVSWLDKRAHFVCATPPGGRHLDAGCSECSTLRHFTEMRPDLRFEAVDYMDFSACVPPGVAFHRVNLITDRLPFEDASFDSITLMHVMEHLPSFGLAPSEFARVLKPGGRLYIEGPGPRSVLFPSSRGTITLNFYDDPTHLAPLSFGRIARVFGRDGLSLERSGIARCWPLILAMPWSLLKRDFLHFLAGFTHLGGWTIYCQFRKEASAGASSHS